MHRTIVRAALTVALASTSLAAPAARASDAPPPGAPDSGVPAVVLLLGAAPTTVTVDLPPSAAGARGPVAAALLALCADDNSRGTTTQTKARPDTGPCPPARVAQAAATFAVVKQPSDSEHLAATVPDRPEQAPPRLPHQLLPRSGLPAGRLTHIEPRPA